MKIILASKSPRRKELLSMITNNFEVIVSNVEERVNYELVPSEIVKELALQKAEKVFEDTKNLGDRIVIGSDTMVVKDNKIYGKPKNHDDAMSMLKELKNAKHEVNTGLAIIAEKNGKLTQITDVSIASVYFSDITDEELEDWIATGEPFDKAGGYAVQGKFGVFIEKIEGDYYTVVGLPIRKVYTAIKEITE